MHTAALVLVHRANTWIPVDHGWAWQRLSTSTLFLTDSRCRLCVCTTQGDRFIPKRSALDGDMARYTLNENMDPQTPGSASKRTPSKDTYKTTLANNMLGTKGPAKILTLQADAPKPPEGHINNMRVLYSQNKVTDYKKKTTTRYIPQAPEKILDAPELMDDYYLNLLDWSSTNILAVALGQTVYLWNASTGNIDELCTTPEESDHITSVSWVQDGNYVAVGTNNSEVQIWDVGGMRQIRSMKGHRARGESSFLSFVSSLRVLAACIHVQVSHFEPHAERTQHTCSSSDTPSSLQSVPWPGTHTSSAAAAATAPSSIMTSALLNTSQHASRTRTPRRSAASSGLSTDSSSPVAETTTF
jgi:WD40 repeat protein